MAEHPVPMTADGLAKLERELDELKHVRRPQVAERIRQSKELTSTQNNVEYDDAKNDQAFVEGRILTLEQMITDATLIDEEHAHRATRVEVGSLVTVSEGKDKKGQEFHIVGSAKAAPKEGRISNESMVRGPTTGGRWAFASKTPALSKHLGCCPHCESRVQSTAEQCNSCTRYLDWPAQMTVNLPGTGASDADSSSVDWTNS